ncbi:plasmid pRiA4b ORF-3 family protein [Dactylosporangium sp. NPDC005572]|uniref:plasmid pRiA4b ORF-3 family protein n=1 Tax=Dactylosporangium sp. NPDC005572 TaxID=3156889 RepID=UPI00339DB7D2
MLRPRDVPAVAAAIGITPPDRTRTAADIEALHRPWTAAQAIGLITVDGSRAVAKAATVADPLDAWWSAFLAVLEAESNDRRGEGAVVLCRALLLMLADEPPPSVEELEQRLPEQLIYPQLGAAWNAFRRGVDPVDAALDALAEFGAVDADHRLTALGRWACDRFAAATPPPITPDLPADDLLARAARLPEPDGWHAAQRWLADRDLEQAATEILAAAADATPAARIFGADLVGALGEKTRPAWQAALDRPMLAPHARSVLGLWDGTDLDETDRRWLAVECALAVDDIEEAYHRVDDAGGMAIVAASTHPGAPGLHEALTAAGRPPRRVYRLKVVLSDLDVPVWRTLRVPATITLDVLHAAIQAAFDWDDDHMHLFESGRDRYSDGAFALDDADEESAVRLVKVMPDKRATMTYVYDLGDWWEHRITVERIDELPDPDAAVTIECVAGHGDAPIEDWDPQDGPATTPFDPDAINRELAELFS